jgi:uncharacterized protein (DUF433 family)
MPALDWSQCSAVESIPGKVSGAWVLKGTRTPVKVLFENLEAGMSIEEVIEQFPVTRPQLDSLMAFVARSLERVPRTVGAHIEEGYLQAERGELIDGEQARREVHAMKNIMR